MADMIFRRDKQFGDKQAWHGGTEVVPVLTREVVFPWQVIKSPVIITLPTGAQKTLPGLYIPVASDDFLPFGYDTQKSKDKCGASDSEESQQTPQICSETSYGLVTPEDCWERMERVLSGTHYKVVSAGTVKNRGIHFISVELSELKSFNVGKREFQQYLNFLGSMAKLMQHCITQVMTCAVCANTVRASFEEKSDNRFVHKHSSGIFDQLKGFEMELEKRLGMAAVFKASMESLNATECLPSRAERIFAGYYQPKDKAVMSTRMQNTVGTLVTLHTRGDGNEGKTMLDTLSAVTQLETRGEKDSTKDLWKRFEASEFGLGAKRKADFAAVLTTPEKLEKVEKWGDTVLLRTAEAAKLAVPSAN